MGPVYDQPRETLTKEQVDASLRYQIMEVVDRIRWIPDFGHERELDWLRNMHDWMISKKRYWGLALPIYDCSACGTVSVVGGRSELKERAIDGWEAFEGHTPHRPHVDAVRIALDKARENGHPLAGAALASDASFPFPDGPELALEAGIGTIVQPGGSKRDEDVIAAVEKAGGTMVFTRRRHFRH